MPLWPGFTVANLMTARVTLPAATYPEFALAVPWSRPVSARVRAEHNLFENIGTVQDGCGPARKATSPSSGSRRGGRTSIPPG
mgnify:CR=1 FL=1